MRPGNFEPRKEIPLYSVWVKKSAEVEAILKADVLYVDAMLSGTNTCDVFLSNEPHRENRTSVRVLQLESAEEYDLIRSWVSQPEICMLCSILTFKGYEVMLNMDAHGVRRDRDYISFSDRLSEKINEDRRPDPFAGAGAFFEAPVRVIRRKPQHEMMKKFDPKSLDS